MVGITGILYSRIYSGVQIDCDKVCCSIGIELRLTQGFVSGVWMLAILTHFFERHGMNVPHRLGLLA